MKKKTIGFIGGGRIAKIFLQAFKNKGLEFERITVYDLNPGTLDNLKVRFPTIFIETASIETAASSDIVFLAVHPPVIMELLPQIGQFLKKESILVSLAPKITIEKIRAGLSGFDNVARVNPSAPGIANMGMNPVAFAEAMADGAKNALTGLLQTLGEVPVVDESKIEAYAVICAMGSTYFWFQLQKLQELAVQFGMEENEAKAVLSKMLQGTAHSLFHSGIPKEEVMDLVPVKPIGEYEETIKSYYTEKLNGIFERIRP